MAKGEYIYVATTGTAAFKATVRQLMNRTRYKTVPAVLVHICSVLIRDLLKFTPPRGFKPTEETWAQQKKIGITAVARDIGRVFWKLKNLLAFTEPHRQKEWEKAVRSGDTSLVTTLLEVAQVPSRGVLTEPDEAIHQSARRGNQVPKNFTPPYHVTRSGSVNSFVRDVQKRVGLWKHGWAACVRGLGMRGIPAWIMNQRGPAGLFVDQSKHQVEPYILMVNNASGTAKGSANRIMGPPLHMLEPKLVTELNKAIQREFSKVSPRH